MIADFDISNEAELLQRLKQGSRPAFDELVKIHRGKGFAIAFNMTGNPEDAKDALQEAFIKVYLNIKNFKGNSRFSTWFYRIVVNTCLDFLRKRKSRQKILSQPLIDEEGNPKETKDMHYNPEGVVLNRELAARLDICIAELPEKQRMCFILKHESQMSNLQIAQTLQCNITTVKVHLFRAARALQEKISPYLGK